MGEMKVDEVSPVFAKHMTTHVPLIIFDILM